MIRVTSEIGNLKKILLHAPDDGIELVTPDKAVEYLYEDIVYLDKMRKEHRVLKDLLSCFVEPDQVLDIQDLVEEVCRIASVRAALISSVADLEGIASLEATLSSLDAKSLAYTLVTGRVKRTGRILFPPISNYIFCRDIGVVIHNHLLITQANKKPRSRETLLSWFVFHHSTVFDICIHNDWYIKLSSDSTQLVENIGSHTNELSIEGGDVMTFGNDHVFIGISERTGRYAFEKVKDQLFKRAIVSNVVMIEIPKERYCMHLDTIFTRIDEHVCVVYAPLILNDNVLKIKKYKKGIPEPLKYLSMKELLTDIDPHMQFIPCGGGKTPYQEREQWTDGCNLFAIKPGVAVTYDRNKMTTKAIAKAGYKVIKAEAMIKKIRQGDISPYEVERTLILIPSNELSRARGGTHCLTFPLERD